MVDTKHRFSILWQLYAIVVGFLNKLGQDIQNNTKYTMCEFYENTSKPKKFSILNMVYERSFLKQLFDQIWSGYTKLYQTHKV